MADYQTFTVSATRTAPINHVTLLASIRTACGDATAVVSGVGPEYRVKKATAWTGPQIAAVQAAFDAAPVLTQQIAAQQDIDAWPIEFKALVLALIDQLNVIRAALPSPLGPITPAQALAAIRAKAATL